MRFWAALSDTGLKVLRTAPFGGVQGTFPSSTLPPANLNSPGYRMVTIFQVYCVTNLQLRSEPSVLPQPDVNSKASSSPNKPLSGPTLLPSSPSVKVVSPYFCLPYNQHCREFEPIPLCTCRDREWAGIHFAEKCEWAFRRGQLDRTVQPSVLFYFSCYHHGGFFILLLLLYCCCFCCLLLLFINYYYYCLVVWYDGCDETQDTSSCIIIGLLLLFIGKSY